MNLTKVINYFLMNDRMKNAENGEKGVKYSWQKEFPTLVHLAKLRTCAGIKPFYHLIRFNI